VKNPDTPVVPYWDQFSDTAMGRYLLSREHEFIRRVLTGQPRSSRILEVCSCTGQVTRPLYDVIPNVTGLDIDRAALALFQARSGGKPAVAADAQILPFVDGSFDCVIAIQCYRYFDQWLFLQGCERILKERGWLIFQIVNPSSYKRGLKRLLRGRQSDLPDPDEVLGAVVDYGFDVEVVSGYNWVPFVPKVSRLSDSPLVWMTAHIEHALQLDRYYKFSPYILVAAQKRDV